MRIKAGNTLSEDAAVLELPDGWSLEQTNNHVTATRPGDFAAILAAARGLGGETFPIASFAGGAAAIGGTGASSNLQGTLIPIRSGSIVTTLYSFCVSAGSGVTLYKIGLYKKDGTFLGATADLHATLAGNVYVAGAISGGPITIGSDDGYYIGALSIAATTAPTFLRAQSQTGSGSVVNGGARSHFNVNAQTDLAGNVTPADATTAWWFAWS